MTSNNPNLFSEKKNSNCSMISTSLNGPFYKQRSSRINDISSTTTKNEYLYANQNHNNNQKIDLNLIDEINKLEQLDCDKENILNEVKKANKEAMDNFNKKYSNLYKIKKKYEHIRQKNMYLKLMIMNTIKLNNKNKNQ